jgi:molecular chaperone GrpE
MVVDEFLKVLKNNGIEKIDALHKPFDPNFHESVSFMPSDEYPANTVIFEVKSGFKLHDRVIRAAQVILASPKSDSPKTEDDA